MGLRLLFVLSGVPWQKTVAGGHVISFEFARHLAQRGHSVDLLAPAPREIQRDLDWCSIFYVNATRWSLFPLCEYVRVLPRIKSYDLIHAHGGEGAYFALHKRMKKTLPFVVNVNIANATIEEVWRKTPWNTYERWSARLADRVCVLSEFSRQNISNAFNISPRDIEVVYPGVRSKFLATSFSEVSSQRDDRLRLLFVGRLDQQKGLDILLRALPLVVQQTRVALTVIGEGAQRHDYEVLAKDLQIANSVHFRGSLPYEKVMSVYHQADVFVLPSRTESFGLVLAEAMGAGLPVVSTKVGAIPEVVQDEKTGILVSPESPNELALAITRLSKDPDLRRRMGEKGVKVASQRFSWSRSAAQLEDIYYRVIEQCKKRL